MSGAITAYQDEQREKLKTKEPNVLFDLPPLTTACEITKEMEEEIRRAWRGSPMQRILAYEIKARIHTLASNFIKMELSDIQSAKQKINGMIEILALVNK